VIVASYEYLKRPEVVVVTFTGSHRFGMYKDCRPSQLRLKKSLEEFNVRLITYSFSELINILRPVNSSFFYLLTRYGVGAWFWKPIIIRHALVSLNPVSLIYVDADCVFTRDPREIIEAALTEKDIALFSQRNKLRGWVSNRAIRLLNLTNEILDEAPLVTAGIIILRNSEKSKAGLRVWELAMRDPRLLLHPVFTRPGVKHLHDQAILSSLIAKGELDCALVQTGFYSLGVESNTKSLKDSWIYTGDIFPAESSAQQKKRITLIFDYYSRKFYDVMKTIFVFPLHLVFYLFERR